MDKKKQQQQQQQQQDSVMSPDGVHCVPCPKQGNKIKSVVLNRVCILGFFFLNRVRVLNPQLLAYTPSPGMNSLLGGGKTKSGTILV